MEKKLSKLQPFRRNEILHLNLKAFIELSKPIMIYQIMNIKNQFIDTQSSYTFQPLKHMPTNPTAKENELNRYEF